jgi:flap endonuclease-1
MGITGLYNFIKKHAPKAIHQKKYDSYKGKVIAVDVSLLLYQTIIAIRGSGSEIRNRHGDPITHIHTILSKTISMTKRGILPVFVFDGKPPEIKYTTLRKRQRSKQKARDKLCDEELSKKDKLKYTKRCVSISKEELEQCQRLLYLMGVPYVQAPGEADPQCAAMVISKDSPVYGVATDDIDALAFESTVMIKNFSPRKDLLEINLPKILSELKFTQEQFIDFCILVGTEYCPTIPNIGPEMAYDGISTHGSLKEFLSEIEKTNIREQKKRGSNVIHVPEHFSECWEKAKDYYMNAQVVDPKFIDCTWNPVRAWELYNYLSEIHCMKLSTIRDYIKTIQENRFHYTESQEKLTIIHDDRIISKQKVKK